MAASTTRKFFCLFSLGMRSQELFLENICTNFVYKGLRHEMKQKTRRKSVKLARFGTRVESSRLRLRSRLKVSRKLVGIHSELMLLTTVGGNCVLER